jgi:hypothetical protein
MNNQHRLSPRAKPASERFGIVVAVCAIIILPVQLLLISSDFPPQSTPHQTVEPPSKHGSHFVLLDSNGKSLAGIFDQLPVTQSSRPQTAGIASNRLQPSPCRSQGRGFWSRLTAFLHPTVLADMPAPDCIGHYMRCADPSEYSCHGCGSSPCFSISDPDGMAGYSSGYSPCNEGCCCDSPCSQQ